MNKKLTIFLSHSSKDIEKVRKIRDILEIMDYIPLLFYLCCLDDDNDELESFIKREIDARNIFLYCKSQNSEKSIWVKKEVDYIKESSFRHTRYYEIDIDRPLHESIPSLLIMLSKIIRDNTIFISASHKCMGLSNNLLSLLISYGFDVQKFDSNDQETYEKTIDVVKISKNGIFISLITYDYLKSTMAMSELEKASYQENDDDIRHILPIVVNINPDYILNRYPFLSRYNPISIEVDGDEISDQSKEDILNAIKTL